MDAMHHLLCGCVRAQELGSAARRLARATLTYCLGQSVGGLRVEERVAPCPADFAQLATHRGLAGVELGLGYSEVAEYLVLLVRRDY